MLWKSDVHNIYNLFKNMRWNYYEYKKPNDSNQSRTRSFRVTVTL